MYNFIYNILDIIFYKFKFLTLIYKTWIFKYMNKKQNRNKSPNNINSMNNTK